MDRVPRLRVVRVIDGGSGNIHRTSDFKVVNSSSSCGGRIKRALKREIINPFDEILGRNAKRELMDIAPIDSKLLEHWRLSRVE